MTHPQDTPANPAQVTDASEGRYRKKPVVIEAFQMTKERRMDNSDWPNWLHKAWNGTRNEAGTLQRVDMDAPLPDYLQIVTLERLHLVSWGDWIIQGVKGELYPCKPDIFAATYEPALTAAIGAGGQAETKACAICGGPHDNDMLSDICRDCESSAPWREDTHPAPSRQADPECPHCTGTGLIESTNAGHPDYGFKPCPECSSPQPAERQLAEARAEVAEHKRLKNQLVLKAYPAMDAIDEIAEGFRSAVHFVRNNAMNMERDYPEICHAEEVFSRVRAALAGKE